MRFCWILRLSAARCCVVTFGAAIFIAVFFSGVSCGQLPHNGSLFTWQRPSTMLARYAATRPVSYTFPVHHDYATTYAIQSDPRWGSVPQRFGPQSVDTYRPISVRAFAPYYHPNVRQRIVPRSHPYGATVPSKLQSKVQSIPATGYVLPPFAR